MSELNLNGLSDDHKRRVYQCKRCERWRPLAKLRMLECLNGGPTVFICDDRMRFRCDQCELFRGILCPEDNPAGVDPMALECDSYVKADGVVSLRLPACTLPGSLPKVPIPQPPPSTVSE